MGICLCLQSEKRQTDKYAVTWESVCVCLQSEKRPTEGVVLQSGDHTAVCWSAGGQVQM